MSHKRNITISTIYILNPVSKYMEQKTERNERRNRHIHNYSGDFNSPASTSRQKISKNVKIGTTTLTNWTKPKIQTTPTNRTRILTKCTSRIHQDGPYYEPYNMYT